MLTQIKLKNFKIFKEETMFPLAKINLLTGINGRGKSSLLQSLLLMRQSIEFDDYTENIILNGNILELGNYEDVKNKEISMDNYVYFYFSFNFYGVNIDFDIFSSDLDSKNLNIKQLKIYSSENIIKEGKNNYNKIEYEKLDDNKHSINYYTSDNLTYNIPNPAEGYRLRRLIPSMFSPNMYVSINSSKGGMMTPINYLTNLLFLPHYISANRIGSKNFYVKNNTNFRFIDKSGVLTADMMAKKQSDLVNEKLYLGNSSLTVLDQVGEWLSRILDIPNISILIDDKSNDFIITLKFRIGTKEFKPSNVGFGYSYILPIIVSGLIAQEGEILIVENPEAHLHPRAQSRLTEFLAKVASCGVQVFVESHSEHILHGLQIAVKSKEIELTNEDVSVLYFHEKENGYFTQIPIKPNGKIEKWVEGFFDQAEKDLDTILGL